MQKHFAIGLLSLGLVNMGCSSSNTEEAQEPLSRVESAVASPPAALLDSTSWDYSPSWMADTVLGKDRMWWCSDRFNQGEPAQEGDVIKYAEALPGGGWGTPRTVMTPDFGPNEGACTCDPAVVRGSFSLNGTAYGLAMYYTASPTCTTDNKVFVAFSNDGISWVKRGPPIISTQFAGNGSYGAGQAQVRNWNGQSGVQLWHTDTPTNAPARVYERTSNDGITFSASIPLTVTGLQGSQEMAAAGIALSPSAPYFLYLINRDGVSRNLKVYKIAYEDRFTGAWTFVAEVLPGSGSQAAIFEPGFRTDIYGNLFAATFPQIFAGFGCGACYVDTAGCDAAQWQLCQAAIQ